ncbi:MAG: SufE family protein [Bacteroidales bacterium]|nr:SufE family protein [Bacteroidales bacterium]MBQ7213611.1 SufE family protein [Bacteroidales bacterium]MCR5714923.1 SufE family protein [Bacteroidales bacterium]
MTLSEIQDDIIQEFELFDDWLDRYEYLISLSKSLQPLDPKFKTNDYLIRGCQSRVWLTAELRDGKVHFEAETDAIITKGIVSLLIRVLSDRTPEEIIGADLYFIDRIGLRENLSPTRSNGLSAMIAQMKTYAVAFSAVQDRDRTDPVA